MDHLHPLKLDPQGEPYLPVKNHPNIIISTFRYGDGPALRKMMNDERVTSGLGELPSPYTEDDAQWWIRTRREASFNALKNLQSQSQSQDSSTNPSDEPESEPKPRIPEEQIVGAIRIINEDGTGESTCIGSLGINRCRWLELSGVGYIDWERKEVLEKENEERVNGDLDIIWSIGYYLNPDYHRKGIMPNVIQTLLTEWAIPRMKVRKLLGSVFVGNEASLKVHLKLGYKLRETHEKYKEVRGVMRGVYVLDWSSDVDEKDASA